MQEKDVTFENWTDDMFKIFCCLSGNDYVDNLRNIGIKTAYKLVNKCKTISNVIKALRVSGMPLSSMTIDDIKDYVKSLLNAINVYKHQTIFCPLTSQMMPLNPYDYLLDSNNINNLHDGMSNMPGARVGVKCQQGRATRMSRDDFNSDFLGPILDKRIAQQIAKGELNPKTLVPFHNPIHNPFGSDSGIDQLESRADKHGIKRLKVQTAKRDLFFEFDAAYNDHQNTNDSKHSSSSSSSLLQTKQSSSSCKTPPKTTWRDNSNKNHAGNIDNGSDLVWSFFDADENEGEATAQDDGEIDNKKRKRKDRLNATNFQFKTNKVGSSLQTLYRRNKKKFYNSDDGFNNDIDFNPNASEYYRQTVEDWSKREDYDDNDFNTSNNFFDDANNCRYDHQYDIGNNIDHQYDNSTNNDHQYDNGTNIDHQYVPKYQDGHQYIPLYQDSTDNVNNNDDDIRQKLNRNWLALGLTPHIDEDPQQPRAYASAMTNHYHPSSMYNNGDDDDNDVNSMDYWDRALRV